MLANYRLFAKSPQKTSHQCCDKSPSRTCKDDSGGSLFEESQLHLSSILCGLTVEGLEFRDSIVPDIE